jgi:hypothetical protein
MITAAVSELVLTTNRDALRYFHVDSPLTEEAHEVIYKLPDLRRLTVVIERGTSLPSAVLPNLTDLHIKYDHDSDWLQMFHGATLAKLESVKFFSESEQIGDPLEAFERVALAASVQNTLSAFEFYASRPWNPKYSSLLPFTQLTDLIIEFPCDGDCSSNVDDDIIINLARTMPKLETLQLGGAPCRQIPTGVTAKGLVALAHHCPDLFALRVHFQVASLSAPSAIAGMTSNSGSTAPRRDCASVELEVGEIPVPEESVLMVALTLARISPRIECIDYVDENWEKVVDVICLSGEIVDCLSKEHPFTAPRGNFSDISPRATLENGS